MSINLDDKRWLTPSELKELYGFSTSWQAKMRMASNSSNLPFVKIGAKHIRYDRFEIEKWLESHKIKGDAS